MIRQIEKKQEQRDAWTETQRRLQETAADRLNEDFARLLE